MSESRRFDVQPVTVYRLTIDGHTVTDEHGNPKDYPTARYAWWVAENWESQRAPTVEELEAMSDTEVRRRAYGGITASVPPATPEPS